MRRSKKYEPAFVYILAWWRDGADEPHLSAHRDVKHAYSHVPENLRNEGRWTVTGGKVKTAETTTDGVKTFWVLKKVEVA